MSSSRTVLRIPLFLATVIVLGAGCHQGRRARPPASSDSVDVGYGTQAKRDVTGSVTSVNVADAQKNPVTSLADLLEGRVPGLEVRRLSGGRISVRIRGIRSINSSSEPLFVVDGIPMSSEGMLPDIDPHDVGSITVLKDAGSLASYGSRGANGVILINTKKKQ